MTRSTLIGALAVLLLVLAGSTPAAARQHAGAAAAQAQQERMQQHMQQLDETARRMDHLQQRLQLMQRTLEGDLQQLRQRQAEQDRIQRHQRLYDASGAMEGATREMVRTLAQVRQMMGDASMEQDPELRREMERLQEHVRAMLDYAEAGTAALERIRARIRIGTRP